MATVIRKCSVCKSGIVYFTGYESDSLGDGTYQNYRTVICDNCGDGESISDGITSIPKIYDGDAVIPHTRRPNNPFKRNC